MLSKDSSVLNGHLPAPEVHHASVGGQVSSVKGGTQEGTAGR
jgi:hypothetical protein